jgi:hypothetical protein
MAKQGYNDEFRSKEIEFASRCEYYITKYDDNYKLPSGNREYDEIYKKAKLYLRIKNNISTNIIPGLYKPIISGDLFQKFERLPEASELVPNVQKYITSEEELKDYDGLKKIFLNYFNKKKIDEIISSYS